MIKQLSQEQIRAANRLLDGVSAILGARNDADLSRKTGASPAVISNVRAGRLPVGNALLVLLHDATDKPIRELRSMMQPAGLPTTTQQQ